MRAHACLDAAVPMTLAVRGADGHDVSGYAHLGACMAARWLYETLRAPLAAALESRPGYTLQLTGHSIGAACASMVAMM